MGTASLFRDVRSLDGGHWKRWGLERRGLHRHRSLALLGLPPRTLQRGGWKHPDFITYQLQPPSVCVCVCHKTEQDRGCRTFSG